MDFHRIITKTKKKKMRKVSIRICLLACLLLYCNLCQAHDTAILGKEAFISILRTYHPVLRQADLQVQRAAAGVMETRGAFDPRIDMALDRKTFDSKLYYSYFNPKITIPTWYGIDIKAGVEEVVGERVTSEATLGKTSYVGVKIPAHSLFFDSRRATLRQAQSLRQLSEAERSIAVNDLVFDALTAYWNWVREYQLYNIITAAVRVNEERMKFVVTEYEQGNRPAIDTVEAMTQLQGFYLQQNNAWLSFQNAGLELSNYLWLERNKPFEWSANIRPPESELISLPEVPAMENLLAETLNNHPKLQSLRYKTNILETERRLKVQYLLPKISLNANLLSKGYGLPDEISAPLLENNYKMGVDFSLPLFQRTARGAFQAAKIKLHENTTEQERVTLHLQNKVKAYYNDVFLLQQQLKLYEQSLENNIRLFKGEKIRFETGESTLFLLNTRENKVLETTQKLTELRAKWQKSYAGLLWAAGVLQ